MKNWKHMFLLQFFKVHGRLLCWSLRSNGLDSGNRTWTHLTRSKTLTKILFKWSHINNIIKQKTSFDQQYSRSIVPLQPKIKKKSPGTSECQGDKLQIQTR